MFYKKMICIFIAIAMLLLCSCNNTGNDTSVPTPNTNETGLVKAVSLLYRASDSLNPYTAKSKINRELALLMYDPLVKLDTTYQPKYILANTIVFDGKTCTITLKNTLFSDGSTVTANDVVYSYKLAKESATQYATQLSTVDSFVSTDDQTLTIKLKKADPYFANLLDFPIFKAESEKRADHDKIILPPIGSGRYVFDTETDSLIANNSHIEGAPSVKTIYLVNAPDDSVVKHNLENGAVSLYTTDMSDGVIPPMSGSILSVPLNNIVYLGVNLNDSILRKSELRYAVSSALNREEICKDAFHSYATPAAGVFNPAWEDAKGLQNLPSKPDMQNVVANLEVLGYNSKDTDGFYVNENGKGITLSLVSYSENSRRSAAAELVKTQLELAGFHVNLKNLDWDTYVSALNSGSFDLYIAETKLLGNMDVSQLITSNGSLSYGIPNTIQSTETDKTKTPDTNKQQPNQEANTEEKADDTVTQIGITVDSAVTNFYNEQLSLTDIINAFNAELPIIPLCYRSGITVCDASLNINNVSSFSDVYFGISNIAYN